MLMLKVKAGQYVKIGDEIKICVHKGKYEQLHLGIDAPEDLLILRDKLIDQQTALQPSVS